MSHDNRPLRVGITQGDTNGIGPEIIIKSLAPEGMTELLTPVVFASESVLDFYRKSVDMPEFKWRRVRTAADAREGSINLVEVCEQPVKVQPGIGTVESGAAALQALDAAVDALKNKEIDLLVTAPINKEAMSMAGFPFPGHTEYLEANLGDDQKALMLLCQEGGPRVALVTAHIPVASVSEAITKEAILEKLRSLNNTLRKDFSFERPKIAVLSLNPHAGDGGVIGSEEQEIIKPAIEEAFQQKIMAFGPFAADGFFGTGHEKKYDAILAMYHDQGLTPFKMLAMEQGVNFTASLPYVRTSPDHGTGYDIAGKNRADESSMRTAIFMGIDIYRNRRTYIQSHSNPLKKQTPERRDPSENR